MFQKRNGRNGAGRAHKLIFAFSFQLPCIFQPFGLRWPELSTAFISNP